MFLSLSTIEIPSELLVVTIVLKLNFLINLLDKFTTILSVPKTLSSWFEASSNSLKFGVIISAPLYATKSAFLGSTIIFLFFFFDILLISFNN